MEEKKSSKTKKIVNNIVKILTNIVYVLLVIIVIVLIYNIIQVGVLNKPYMNIFGYSFFQVKTGSMSGTLEIGDIIVVKLTNEISENDIITYEKEQILITHRIIEKQEDNLITKGDANNTEDEPIKAKDVIGKVVYVLGNIEIWKQVLKTPEVYTLIIITMLLMTVTAVLEENKE